MGPLLVVVDEPSLGRLVHFDRAPEDVSVEKLVAHARVERFDPSVLVRLARIDELQVDLVIDRPFQQRLTGQLRPVVDSKPRWVTTNRRHGVEFADDAWRGKRERGLQAQGLTRKTILERQ